MSVDETSLYVLRRKDTGEYFKRVKPSWLKNWAADDPRLKQWTPKLKLASLYPLSGIRPLAGQWRHHYGKPVDVEVVRVSVVVDGVLHI